MPVVIHVVTETSLSFNKDNYISMLFCEISCNTCMRKMFGKIISFFKFCPIHDRNLASCLIND